jgi:hypothetical protein
MKVWAKNEDVRKIMKHPTAGGFNADGSADWPDDTFTYRRMRDGDISQEQPTQPTQSKPKK